MLNLMIDVFGKKHDIWEKSYKHNQKKEKTMPDDFSVETILNAPVTRDLDVSKFAMRICIMQFLSVICKGYFYKHVHLQHVYLHTRTWVSGQRYGRRHMYRAWIQRRAVGLVKGQWVVGTCAIPPTASAVLWPCTTGSPLSLSKAVSVCTFLNTLPRAHLSIFFL